MSCSALLDRHSGDVGEPFAFSADVKFAMAFYALVRANLYYLDYSATDTGTPRRFPDSALFEIRGKFLGCVHAPLGGRVLGLFCLTERDGRAFVESGYVAAKYQGNEIGSGLLEMACDKLVEMDKKPIHFEIESSAMGHLLDKLITAKRYPFETLQVVGARSDFYDGLGDYLFTPDERPAGS
jgi:hypothetical protein